MSRRILFKAKRKDNGEWVEGGYFSEPYTEKKFIICWNSFGLGFNEFIEVESDTICQYTGLTDKNGNRIWENDILMGHGNDKDLSKAVFGEFNIINVETLEIVDIVIGWHTEVIETDALSKYEPFCRSMPLTDYYIKRSEFEVIGNIFDNADLLEVE